MKKSKTIILIAFILNLLSLLFLASPMKSFVSVLGEFSQQKVLTSLVAPVIQVVVTVAALVLWFYFRSKEKQNQTVKYADATGYIFIVLAPVLFFVSYFITASLIYNLAATSEPVNQSSNNSSTGNTDSNGIKTITPSEIQNVLK